MKLTFFDVEYANSKNKSICQMALICRDSETGEDLLPSLNLYLNPEDGFNEFSIRVHGITPHMVADKPTFPMVWGTIKEYFQDAIIVGHNVASADLDALVKSLIRYEIEVPSLTYICTYDLARRLISYQNIENYKLSTLCEYFNINVEHAHDAFYDTLACVELFYTLVREYKIDLENITQWYCGACIPKSDTYSTYVCDNVVRKKVAEFYGIIKGINIDHKITDEEIHNLTQWKTENLKYDNENEISEIIKTLDKILTKSSILKKDIKHVERIVEPFLSTATTACETLATQILNGMLRGIIGDGEVTRNECVNLYKWIYEHSSFMGTYPFRDVVDALRPFIVKDTYTDEDSKAIISAIHLILNPVQSQATTEINQCEISGKVFCLTGNFAYGKKSEVEKFIKERGGIIEGSVKRTTNILLVGANESQAYAHGHYGTKVLKAIENNKKGSNIQIIKEEDFFNAF